MKIKNFGFDAPRETQTMQRILSDIEKRAPLPQLNLVYQTSSLRLPTETGGQRMIPCISCTVNNESKEAFHAAVVDTDPTNEELTVLLTHTNGGSVGFRTIYTFKPQAAVFISFDILKFFYERVPTLEALDEEGNTLPNPLFHKPLEVENALKAAYKDLPESYTWKLNVEARKPDNKPIIVWHAEKDEDSQSPTESEQ